MADLYPLSKWTRRSYRGWVPNTCQSPSSESENTEYLYVIRSHVVNARNVENVTIQFRLLVIYATVYQIRSCVF